jgi:hypothetical protein
MSECRHEICRESQPFICAATVTCERALLVDPNSVPTLALESVDSTMVANSAASKVVIRIRASCGQVFVDRSGGS